MNHINKPFNDCVNAGMDKHRNIPFWSWNDRLENDELREQIGKMNEAGFGGYFMHARGGLETPYMGEEWMDAIRTCMEEGKKYGMESWAYDENGWPSGFANGVVPAMGEEFQQKGLDACFVEDGKPLPERTLGVYRREGDTVRRVDDPKAGDLAVFVVINRYYIDSLNKESIRHFLEVTHAAYEKELGDSFQKDLKGFFTDEPQYANGYVPWSPCLEEVFAQNGEDIREKLGALFLDTSADKAFRWRYYKRAAKLYQEGFIKQLSDWCHAHGMQLTGHVMSEDNLVSQLYCTGGAMPTYEYFDMPGIDWLGRAIASPVVPKQLGSAAAQFGKKRTLTESFALCGWDVRFNELRWIAQWQFVNGVNTLCQHLSAYTIRGLRKRDYPASLHTQEPWFEVYRPLQDYFARAGAALEQGTETANVLLLHPLGNAAGQFAKLNRTAVDVCAMEFDRLSQALSDLHVRYHFGDETILAAHGSVNDSLLTVAQAQYDTVVLPKMESIAPETATLLTKFIAAGGKVYAVEEAAMLVGFEQNSEWEAIAKTIPVFADAKALSVVLYNDATPHVLSQGEEEALVHAMVRDLDDGRRLYYLASLSPDALGERTLSLNGHVGLTEYNLSTGEETVLTGRFDGQKTEFTLSFGEAESHLLLTADPQIAASKPMPAQVLSVDTADWRIVSTTPNVLTLDYAAYRIDGGEWQDETPIILLQDKLLALRKPCHIDLRVTFCIEQLQKLNNIEFVMEMPQNYTISVNGQLLTFKDEGYFRDKSFRRCAIQAYLQEGENTVMLSGDFSQPQKVYDVLFGENVHEAERNKLTFETELESFYLIGDFGVRAQDEVTYTTRNALWAGRRFVLVPQKDSVKVEDITTQGFWFFAGNMRLQNTATIHKEDGKRYVIKADTLRVPAAKVFVNGQEAGLLALSPYEVDVTAFVRDGENRVELELFTGCRNMLGPHHRVVGESYMVAPATFTDKPDWEGGTAPFWRDDYCFVTTGVCLANG